MNVEHLPSGYLTVFNGIDGPFIDGKWPIEIDGLPLIAWWIFPWQTVSHNQMVDVFFFQEVELPKCAGCWFDFLLLAQFEIWFIFKMCLVSD